MKIDRRRKFAFIAYSQFYQDFLERIICIFNSIFMHFVLFFPLRDSPHVSIILTSSFQFSWCSRKGSKKQKKFEFALLFEKSRWKLTRRKIAFITYPFSTKYSGQIVRSTRHVIVVKIQQLFHQPVIVITLIGIIQVSLTFIMSWGEYSS